MSQQRRAKQAINQSMDLAAVNKTAAGKSEKQYPFHVNTPFGPTSFQVPHSAMKVCACGCSLFDCRYLVTFVKPKDDVSGADWQRLRVEVYVCSECGREVTPDDRTIGQRDAEATGDSQAQEPEAPKSSLILQG